MFIFLSMISSDRGFIARLLISCTYVFSLVQLWTGRGLSNKHTSKQHRVRGDGSLMYRDRHTKPGGWVELKDWVMTLVSTDNSLPEDSKLYKHHRLLCGACEKIGRTPSPGSHLKKWAEQAGFKNVHEQVLPVPIGLWPKDKKLVCTLLSRAQG